MRWLDGITDGGQEGLACCGSWGRKESDTTERLNWNWNGFKLLGSHRCTKELRLDIEGQQEPISQGPEVHVKDFNSSIRTAGQRVPNLTWFVFKRSLWLLCDEWITRDKS